MKEYNNDINGWSGSASQPNVGTKNQPSLTPSNGYNNSSPSYNALNVAATDDYTGWNWEQILNGVLNFALPGRDQVTATRWTVTDDNMNDDHSLFKIFGAGWVEPIALGPAVRHKDFLVYLNPAVQDSQGPWDEFYNTPASQLATAISDGPAITGVLDPRDFAGTATAVQGVEGLFGVSAVEFGSLGMGLNSEAGQFKGAAGEAFAQLINNLNTYAESIYSQMSPAPGAAWSDLLNDNAQEIITFFTGLWNAVLDWQNRLDWSPLGAIFQALLDGGVVINNGGGNYSVIPNVLQNDTFGNLLTDDAWVSVETAAKSLWNTGVAASLDEAARPLLVNLAASFANTTSALQPLQVPALNAIGANSDPNAADPNTADPNLGNDLNSLANSMGAGFNGLANGLGNVGDGLGNGISGLANGLGDIGNGLGNVDSALGNPGAGLNSPVSALGDPGAGLNSPVSALGDPGAGLNNPAVDAALASPTGLDSPVSALGNPAGASSPVAGLGNIGAGLNTPGGLNTVGPLSDNLASPSGASNPLAANPNAVAAGLGTSPAAASALQNALGDSQAEQKQLQKALSLAPSSGPLHNALENALAANAAQQSALQNGLAGNTPVGEALGNALADNGKVQSALGNALDSGQVPASGPLRTALQKASGDNAAAKKAADQALQAAVPGGGSLEKALAGNGRAASELRKALISGQVPATGPLHDTLTKALGDVGRARHALDQALQGGGQEPASIQRALTDNKAAQTELQRALAQAPKTGALHNELANALADTRQTGTALHQALTSAGVAGEPGQLGTGPTAGMGDLAKLLRGGKGISASVGGPSGLSAGLGGGAGVGGGAGLGHVAGVGGAAGAGAAGVNGAGGLSSGLSGGLSGGAAGAASGGAAAAAGPSAGSQAMSAGDASAVPFSTPMAGGMGMGGGQGQPQERERTTWLSEDEDVWGTDPGSTPSVLGRDFGDDEDELDTYEDAEPASEPRRQQVRAWGR